MAGIKIGKTTVDGEQSSVDVHQPLSKASVMQPDDILFDGAGAYLSETQRTIMLSSALIDAGAQLPASSTLHLS